MDIASLLGIILCFVMMIFGIWNGAGIENLVKEYADVPSAIITFGGAFAATLTSHSLADYINGLKSFTLVFKAPALNTARLLTCQTWPVKRVCFPWKRRLLIWMTLS